MSEAARPGGFVRLVRAELLRLRSRRLFAWLALGTTALLTLTYLTIARPALRTLTELSGYTDGPFGGGVQSSVIRNFIGAIQAAFLSPLLGFGLVLGSSHVGAEWASRGITNLLFWEPRRWRVLGAKFVAIGGALAVISMSVVTLLTLTFSFGDVSEFVSTSSLLLFAVRVGLLVSVVGVLGAAIAAVTRSTTAALGTAFVLLAVVEPLLYANVDGYERIGISVSAFRFIAWDQFVGGMSPVASLGLLLAYAAAFMAIAITVFKKQEMS